MCMSDARDIYKRQLGQPIILLTDRQTNVIPIPDGSRIRALLDDYIGFYEYDGFIITYDDGDDYRTAKFDTDETTFDWGAATSGDNRDHAIHARVTPSQIPTFTNLDDTVAISNNAVAGTVLFTVAAIDSDIEDAGLLTIAHSASSGSAAAFFELDLNTLEVKIKSGVSLSPGDHSMTFTVTDPCARWSSGILTIRVENDPPVITSLATSSSTTISEDLSAETLLHTLDVTDTQPTTCKLLFTGVPFVIKRISGSTKFGIFLSTGASLDYDAQNAYVLDLSCTDTYDDTAGVYTVYLIRNEPPSINGLPRATDIQEDVVVETLHIFCDCPENTAVTCSVTAITPNQILYS
ncbi:unnamed protein product [Mytilus edulis]|uniref:Cadherin domain-containing protein n=1 Tax=Mytilus edulis TaxID=6550 RepID=A0A8S3R1M7_MYTED|nr:unnamed protein product [Mytilus edulis]